MLFVSKLDLRLIKTLKELLNLFITGTDTGVGKTFITDLLLSSIIKKNQSAVGFKPISCGDRNDAEVIFKSSHPEPSSIELINPVHLKTPAAPLAASLIEGREVDLDLIKRHHRELKNSYDNVIVEGAGGWAVPITAKYCVGDLAAELCSDVLIVVDNKLGALNKTILTYNAIRDKGLRLAGIVLNHVEPERDTASISNKTILEEVINPPMIIDILHGETEIEYPF